MRYRTPRKKTTNWKTLLGAVGLGAVMAAIGVVFLVTLPTDEEVREAVAAAAEERADEGDSENAGDDESGGVPATDPRNPANRSGGRVSGTFLGVGLILMGILLPVGAMVIEKTSGKKWNRRAGKKHPFKRKI